MRTIRIALIILLHTYGFSVTAQEIIRQKIDTLKEHEIYSVIQVMPVFPGGADSLICFIESKMNFDLINSIDTTGRCYYTFTIDSVGKSHFSDVRGSISSLLDIEMKRVLESLPIWTPGQRNGKMVSVNFTIPINIPYQKRCKK